jgi:hypothetical protein
MYKDPTLDFCSPEVNKFKKKSGPQNLQIKLNNFIVPSQKTNFYEQQQLIKDSSCNDFINYEDQIPDTLCKQLHESQKLDLEDFTAP